MSEERVRYARNGDVHLAYRVLGAGEIPLVFVPGYISNVEIYDDPGFPFAPLVEQLAQQTRLILWDKARIGAVAGPGEVLTSRTVRDHSAGSGLSFESLGAHHLKGLPEEVEVFRVTRSETTAR